MFFKLAKYTIVCAAVAIVAWAGWVMFRPDPAPVQTKEIYTADQYQQFLEIRNRGLALLENKDFDGAISEFEELASLLPAEELPIRNLAIARTLKVVDSSSKIDPQQNPVEYEQAVRAANDNITKVRKNGSLAGQVIAGELAMFVEEHPISGVNLERAVDLFQNAANTASQTRAAEAPLLYKVYQAGKDSDDEKEVAAAQESVQNAHSKDKMNLWLLREALLVQAETKSPLIDKVLKNAREAIEPFNKRFKELRNVDMMELLEQAFNQVQDGNYNSVRAFANLLFAEVTTKLDQRRVDRNLLEYVLVDFSRNFTKNAFESGAIGTANEPIEVSFDLNSPLEGLSNVQFVRSLDFDLDGLPDIASIAGNVVRVHTNTSAGEWELAAEWEAPGEVTGLLAVDLDRDFDTGVRKLNKEALIDTDLDIVVWGPAGAFVLENVRDGETRSLKALDPSPFGELKNVSVGCALDVEHDGDLDLLFGDDKDITSWINSGKLRFQPGDGTKALEIPNAKSVIPMYWDKDVSIDIFVTTDDPSNTTTFLNKQHGIHVGYDMGTTFDWGVSGPTLSEDFNNDGQSELICVTQKGLQHVRYSIQKMQSEYTTLLKDALGALSFDYDNDGYLDVLGWSATGLSWFRNTGQELIRVEAMEQSLSVTSVDSADIDGDGDLDLVVSSDGQVRILTNNGGNTNNSVRLVLRAEPNPEQFPASRVNMHGIGSVVECRTGTRYQKQIVTGPYVHLGLGDSETADAVRIIWTDGVPQNVLSPDLSKPVLAQQDLKGSCPYLYTWNGSEFEFVTDLLWAAPLGLQTAQSKLMPWREWEYLKIENRQLRPMNGTYRLQITEELWEAAYFDEVKLLAIDHPADTQIFTNEKVGPAAMAEHKIHTVSNPQYPVAAQDQTGADVLPFLQARDGKFLRSFESRITQGLTSEHFLELDPGKLKNPRDAKLVLTGWMFPTDTSLNIAISQNPDLNPPRPPSIQVRDENGQWVETIPFCGFPGGKTKSIVVDLSNAFLCDDLRLRIVTSMQICWDEAFFVSEPTSDFKVTELSLNSADLHYRGLSAKQWSGHNGPEQFDYANVSTDLKWVPMKGRFTRYGDVAELLTARDDKMVVMGSGDEMTLEFAADESNLPPGWIRDFVIYNVGWDKDADLNTISGQTSEPLPFQAMREYPPIDGTRSRTDGYDEYLNTYQTREQSWSHFSNQLRKLKIPPSSAP